MSNCCKSGGSPDPSASGVGRVSVSVMIDVGAAVALISVVVFPEVVMEPAGVGVGVNVTVGVRVDVGSIHKKASNEQAISQVRFPPAYPRLIHDEPFRFAPSHSSGPSIIVSPHIFNLTVVLMVE